MISNPNPGCIASAPDAVDGNLATLSVAHSVTQRRALASHTHEKGVGYVPKARPKWIRPDAERNRTEDAGVWRENVDDRVCVEKLKSAGHLRKKRYAKL